LKWLFFYINNVRFGETGAMTLFSR